MTDYITIEEFMREIEELGFTYERGAFNLYIKAAKPIMMEGMYRKYE